MGKGKLWAEVQTESKAWGKIKPIMDVLVVREIKKVGQQVSEAGGSKKTRCWAAGIESLMN